MKDSKEHQRSRGWRNLDSLEDKPLQSCGSRVVRTKVLVSQVGGEQHVQRVVERRECHENGVDGRRKLEIR